MKHIKKYVEMMKAENVSRAVLVLQQNLTPFARSFLQELEPKIHLEIFQVSPEQQEAIASIQFNNPILFSPMSTGISPKWLHDLLPIFCFFLGSRIAYKYQGTCSRS